MKAHHRFEAGFGPEAVDQVRDWLAHELNAAGVASELVYSVVTLADEIFCNVMEHGKARWVELGLSAGDGDGLIALAVRDDGEAFDPTPALQDAASRLENPVQERKLGLYMVSRLGDHLAYRRDGDVNELRLTLRETVD
jgi:anti-sigma regulatory factor (Ser/Thr protein kinase)